MTLTGEQRVRLREAFLPPTWTTGSVADLQLIATRCGKNYDYIVGTGSNYVAAWLQLHVEAERTGWEERLVEVLHAQWPNHVPIRVLFEEVVTARIAAVDRPFDRCWLADEPFVNRADLRDHLRSLAAGDGKRVLLVHGGAESGKTHSRHLINHIADAHRHKRAYVPMNLKAGMTPYDVARTILAQFDCDPVSLPAQGETTAEAWVLELAGVIEAAVSRAGVPHWIVLDTFQRRLPRTSRDFIEALAQCAEMHRKGLRVILLGYPRDLPHDVQGAAVCERLIPMTEADFVACAERVLAEKHHTPVDVVYLQAEVQRIFASPASTTKLRVAELRRIILRILNQGGVGVAPPNS